MPTLNDTVSTALLGSVSSLTFSHTVNATGANRVLIVRPWHWDGAGPKTVSTVTYGGQALTFAAGVTAFAANNEHRNEIWYLINPPTGANNVIVTWSGSISAARAAAGAYVDTHQTTPVGTAANASGTTATPTVAVSSASGELVIDLVNFYLNTAGAVTFGAGQTQEFLLNQGVSNQSGGGSSEPGAASVTMSWTLPQSEQWATLGIPLKPAAAGAVVPPRLIQRGQAVPRASYI